MHDLQICALRENPSLLIATYHSFFMGLWIVGLVYDQLLMVGIETTTFECIKKRHDKKFHRISIWKVLKNVIYFIFTGKFKITSISNGQYISFDKNVEGINNNHSRQFVLSDNMNNSCRLTSYGLNIWNRCFIILKRLCKLPYRSNTSDTDSECDKEISDV